MSLLDQLSHYSYQSSDLESLLSFSPSEFSDSLAYSAVPDYSVGKANQEIIAHMERKQTKEVVAPGYQSLSYLSDVGKNDTNFQACKNKHIKLSKIVSILNSKHLKLYYQVFIVLQKLPKCSQMQSKPPICSDRIARFINNINAMSHRILRNAGLHTSFAAIRRIAVYRASLESMLEIERKIGFKNRRLAFRKMVSFDHCLSRLDIIEAILKHFQEKEKFKILHFAMGTLKFAPKIIIVKPCEQITSKIYEEGRMSRFQVDSSSRIVLPIQFYKLVELHNHPQLEQPWVLVEQKSEGIPSKLQIRYTEMLESEVNDMHDNAILFLGQKGNQDSQLSQSSKIDKRRSSLNWTVSDIKMAEDNLGDFSGLKISDLDRTTKTINDHSATNLQKYFSNISYLIDPDQPKQRENCKNSDKSTQQENTANFASFKKDKTLAEIRHKIDEIYDISQPRASFQEKVNRKQSWAGVDCSNATNTPHAMGTMDLRERKSMSILELEKDKKIIENLIEGLKGKKKEKMRLNSKSISECNETKLMNTISKIENIASMKRSSLHETRPFKPLKEKNSLPDNPAEITHRRNQDRKMQYLISCMKDEELVSPVAAKTAKKSSKTSIDYSYVQSSNNSAKKDTKKLISLKARRLDVTTKQPKPRQELKLKKKENQCDRYFVAALPKYEERQFSQISSKKDFLLTVDKIMQESFPFTKKDDDLMKIKDRILSGMSSAQKTSFERDHKPKVSIKMFEGYK